MKFVALVSSLSVSLAINLWPDKPSDETTPVGVRLGLGSSSSMNVGWSSYARPEGKVCVQYGTSPNELSQEACSSNYRTYGTSRVWYSQVELTGLRPKTEYYYQINAKNTTTNSFTMLPAPGDNSTHSFAALADLGYHSYFGTPIIDSHPTVQRWLAMKDDFDFTFFPGDYAYADDFIIDLQDLGGFLEGEDAYQSLLERFYDLVSPISKSQPLMVTAGNHEASCVEIPIVDHFCPSGQKNFTDIRNRFNGMFPTAYDSISNDTEAINQRKKAQQLADPPFWYSFDSGLVHYVFIDTETDFQNAPDQPGQLNGLDGGPFGFSGQQLAWLEADLASVDRSVTPWIIVGGHRPWYTISPLTNRCGACMKAFEEILYHYGVDLVVMGHVHNSQRFKPMYNDAVDGNGYDNPTAPMYIIVGGTGNSEGLDKVHLLDWTTTGLDWANGDDLAFAIVDVHSATDLSVRFIQSDSGNELDYSALHKDHTERFVRQ